MIRDNINTIYGAVSGERAYRTIEKLTTFHRIAPSPEYHRAVDFCQQQLQASGVQCDIVTFPANEHTFYWTHMMNKEWSCDGAFFDLTWPEAARLCDFDSNCNSLMHRSGPADFRDKDVEIVLMDRGTDPAAYEDIDLSGKVIFISIGYQKFRWALKKGAIGVLAERMSDMDGFRTKGEMENTRQSMGFSWNNEAEDKYQFGFVLSSRLADKLRETCRRLEADYQKDPTRRRYPTARLFVDSKIYDGTLKIAVGYLPGQTDEEIVVCAHLCHPKTSANDNASGVGGSIELINALAGLIRDGKLEKPRRGIKLILMPEFTGSYAYLATHEDEIPKMMAGINLDMIGGSQKNNGCCTVITDVPNAAPSFVHEVACLSIDEIAINASMYATGTERDDLLREAERILVKNAAACPVYYQVSTIIVDQTVVTDVTQTQMGVFIFRNAKWVD